MKILIFSPLEDFLITPKEFLPLGALYLSSYLKQHGHEVDVIHGNPEDIKDNYDIYAISSSTPQYPKAKLTLQYIKQRDPNAKVVLGGPHTTSPKCAQEAITDGFDFVAVGQGEKALLKIVGGHKNNKIVTGENLNQEEVDNLLPDRDALNIEDYGFPLDGGRAATIITARGCPYQCSFCSISCGRVTFRSPDKVLEEIDMLVNKYGFDKLLFLDDTFTVNKRRLITILEGLKDYDIMYRCYARSDDSSDEKLLKLMLESGCVELGVGIESGNQKILDLVNKMTNVKENLEFIKKSQKVGIGVNTFIMVGLPRESKKTIKETREFMKNAAPVKFGYNIFTPFPDCPIVVNYKVPFESGPFKGKSFKDFITLYPMPYEKAVTKAKSIDDCFVSTTDLSRNDIVEAYHEEFEKFVDITGFDPRKRGGRDKISIDNTLLKLR